jgi:Flp pilus assembly protein TadD
MKAKHRNRRPPNGNPPSAALKGIAPKRGHGVRNALVVLAVIGVAAGAWFASRWWGPSTGLTEGPLAVRQEVGSDQSTNGPAGRPGARRLTKDRAFIDKVNHGTELLAQGKPAEAVEVFTEAAQANPKDEDVQYDLGLALARLGKSEEAVQHYEEALRLFPEYVEAHNNLGNVLLRLGRTEEAISHFESAVKFMPDYASAHNNLGTALGRIGRTNDAMGHFEQATKINPEYWEAHFNLGTSYLQAGRLSDAQSEFEKVLQLHPDFPPAQAALANIHGQLSGGGAPKSN